MMRRIIPPMYYNHPATVQLFDTLQKLIEDTIVKEKDILLSDASGVGTSADLSMYAAVFNCPPDAEIIRSRMRSYGIANIPLIKEISRSYKHGEVEVTDDKTAFVLTVRFASKLGLPTNYEQLIAQLRKVVPAHYRIDIEIMYHRWRDYQQMTWAQLRDRTWEEIMNV